MIFLTRKKLNKTIAEEINYDKIFNDALSSRQEREIEIKINNALLEQKETDRKNAELKKWQEFFEAEKIGFLINHDGLECECVKEVTSNKMEFCNIGFGGLYESTTQSKTLTLKIGEQIKTVTITASKPQDISFVMED